ncbi:MAG TPA: uroporphyrinogen decarboxylase family protein [Phycisphaerae bacterium]|nr:uroporphyrinogen decarboxylase family protein [Phycisphaerae bacterium]HRY66870.1 uroporphyrinogen decarboxylase family protein [Phycisphaerae bacterium]HSA26928.1 uroporphyrinogen decarboxylase family protein [Phycisphaerae bacterium]
MTSKERMMRALAREKPDRLPVTVHQWQPYHLNTCMAGIDALAAFRATGMDAAIQYFETMGQFWVPESAATAGVPDWRDQATVVDADPVHRVVHHTITTPGGRLSYKTEGNLITTWITEYLIKHPEDVDLIERYMPIARLDRHKVAAAYDAVGDAGVLRGFVWGDQAGCWQHACCLMDVQELILAAHDDPPWVHRLMTVLLEKKLRFIEESLRGAKFDLIETGGGAGSDTVISPAMHREFCLPYDRRMHQALHDTGHRVSYHTCGGMMYILDQIVANGTDASETLSPPGVGGNITDPAKVRQAFAGKVAMIGGMDQYNVLTRGTADQIRAEVRRLFEGFGRNGGYILSVADHFFDTPVENLRVYSQAARECAYN